ncbi:MAG: hypothetical protein FWD06_04100 [Oscillospiraceae bacterium]|nr:hypothetical protein [Oscillospiraceae bacterium]
MTKRILAIFLAIFMLASVFAVAVSATETDHNTGTGGIVFAPDTNASMARVPNSIMNRAARYDAIATSSTNAEVRDTIFAIVNPSETTTIASQWQLNRHLNAQNQAVANVLRANNELSWFNALGSWILGNFWWLWVPIIGLPLLSAVGAFFALL